MASILSSNLTIEEKRKALIRISQFVLRDEIDEIRDDLQENIVETALFWGTKENQFVSKKEIAELIQKEICLITFPDLIFDAIVSRLLTKGTIELDENGLYHLKGFRRMEIEEKQKSLNRKINYINERFIQRLAQEYGKELSNEQKNEALEKFYSFLASLVMEKSDLVARIMTQKSIEIVPTDLPIQVLIEILAKVDESKLREAEKRTIEFMFRNGSEDFCSFLFSVAQNLVCIQVLNLDPECQTLEREAFANKALFLDTNVLIVLLCPTHWMHNVAEQLVSLTKLLGAKCLVTKRTYQEYLSLLQEADNIYMKWQAPYRFLENAGNEFLSSFWFEKKSTPSQSWKGYYYRMKQIESVLKKLGIDYFTENVDQILKNPHFESIKDNVYSCYKSIKKRQKSPRVCEHDAFHLLLMRELRKKDATTVLGPNYWFATGDESLLCVDNKINTLTEYTDKTPSSMVCGLWLEMISPFLPLNVREKDAYAAFSILIKHQFATIPFEIETSTLLEIQGSWMKYEWLDATDIVRIQSEEWVKKYIAKVREARNKGVPPSKMEELAKVFADKLEKELKIIKEEKIAELSRKIQVLTEGQEKLNETIQEQQKTIINQQELLGVQWRQVEQMQSTIQTQSQELIIETRFKQKMRVISAIAGLFLIFSPPLFVFSQDSAY